MQVDTNRTQSNFWSPINVELKLQFFCQASASNANPINCLTSKGTFRLVANSDYQPYLVWAPLQQAWIGSSIAAMQAA